MDLRRYLITSTLVIITTGPWSVAESGPGNSLVLQARVPAIVHPEIEFEGGSGVHFGLGGNDGSLNMLVSIEELLMDGRGPASLTVAKTLRRTSMRTGDKLIIDLKRAPGDKILLFTLTTP